MALRIISKTSTRFNLVHGSKGVMSESIPEQELQTLVSSAVRYCVIESDNETLAHFAKADSCMDTVISLNARLKGIDETKRSKFKANTYLIVGDI